MAEKAGKRSCTRTKRRVRSTLLLILQILIASIAALATVVATGDSAPAKQSYEVAATLTSQLQAELEKLNALLAKDVPAFNDLVRKLDIPALTTRSPFFLP